MKGLLLLLVLNIGAVAYSQDNTGKLTGKVTAEGEALELASVTLLKTSLDPCRQIPTAHQLCRT
jgi:hypothetical protein